MSEVEDKGQTHFTQGSETLGLTKHEIIKKMVLEGKKYREIALRLNDAGHLTLQGHAWTDSTVSQEARKLGIIRKFKKEKKISIKAIIGKLHESNLSEEEFVYVMGKLK